MKSSIKAVFVLGALAAPLGMSAALAQAPRGAPVMADHTMSASRLMGMSIYNDVNQPWGTIEDVIVPPSGEPKAVVSVGKLLGHAKLVTVPLSHLTMAKNHMTMAGTTKAMAESLPAFSYGAGG